MASTNLFSWVLVDLGEVTTSAVAVSLGALLLLIFALQVARREDGPPTLNDPIPGIFNALQFMFDNNTFMLRVQRALKNNNLMRFYIIRKPVYLATGPAAVKAMFGRELMHHVTNQEQMVLFAMPTLQKMNREEVRRWVDDKSGATKTPLPGTAEGIPQRQRLWYTYEHIHVEYLGKPQNLHPLVNLFSSKMELALERYPIGQWVTVSVQDMCRQELAASAMETLFGPELIGLTPDFVSRFWRFDRNAFKLIVGVPKWIDPAVHETHNHFVDGIGTWLENGLSKMNWNGPDTDANWEPLFGGRVVRELVKWMLETNWRKEVIAATLGALIFGLTSNSVPVTIWMLMEMIQDPSLLQAVREEVATAMVIDPKTGNQTLSSHKLVALPLLQSIWTETLRLRINFNITRDVKQPVTINGHLIPKGSILQAPMMVSHCMEDVWAADGHPASEFWAERHVKYIDEIDALGQISRKRVFAMAGDATSYFPFGGGINICPGRQFAKFEVFSAIGLILSRFDIELIGWTQTDGKPSDRAARADLRYSGAGAMPPDRDMKIRWRRIA
ncbi:putative cytochrome P450 [Stachybotrys elegans]|uniref:Cytochrome P450 n=1 Tax=Stachybotrys elegans TaxID=80388 RepID=A0A8K0SV20_9HYPO|nr:putative cytochrome P450 [Stachybotrys elegans]